MVAPVRGVVAQRRARLGGYARVGEPLLTLVHGLTWAATSDWRSLTALTVAAFALAVTALARAAGRLGGTPAELKNVASGLQKEGFTVVCCQLAGHCGTEEDLIRTDWQALCRRPGRDRGGEGVNPHRRLNQRTTDD